MKKKKINLNVEKLKKRLDDFSDPLGKLSNNDTKTIKKDIEEALDKVHNNLDLNSSEISKINDELNEKISPQLLSASILDQIEKSKDLLNNPKNDPLSNLNSDEKKIFKMK